MLKIEAQTRWLRNEELLDILLFPNSHEISPQPCLLTGPPQSGDLFLFDKSITPKWRRDHHEWKKRKNGRLNEHHETLKMNHEKVMTVCYAHSAEDEGFHRRAYWLLQRKDIVLVHYRQIDDFEDNQLDPLEEVYADELRSNISQLNEKISRIELRQNQNMHEKMESIHRSQQIILLDQMLKVSQLQASHSEESLIALLMKFMTNSRHRQESFLFFLQQAGDALAPTNALKFLFCMSKQDGSFPFLQKQLNLAEDQIRVLHSCQPETQQVFSDLIQIEQRISNITRDHELYLKELGTFLDACACVMTPKQLANFFITIEKNRATFSSIFLV